MKRYVVLVCGGRHYHNRVNVFDALDLLHKRKRITKIVQGFATGADRLADSWARSRKVDSTGRKYHITKEMWMEQGKAAGFIRNKAMRDKELPDLVLAFPGGNGTNNMCALADERGILVTRVTNVGRFK